MKGHASIAVLLFSGLVGTGAAAVDWRELDLAFLGQAAQGHVAVDQGRDAFVLSWQARGEDGCAALRVLEIPMPADGQAPPLDEHPVRTVAQGCDWFVNWADFPSLVVADNGDWVTHWLQRTAPGGYAYEILLSRSNDRGRTWSPPIRPHSDRSAVQHGFVAMAPERGDRVRLVWLDGRANGAVDGDARTAHDHAHDAAHVTEAGMRLYGAIVDGEGRVSDELELDPRVCSCCQTALARTASGLHQALYRGRDGDEIRDIHLIEHGRNGWSRGRALNPDGWRIAGCPVNGPALAAGSGGSLAAWTTQAEPGQLAVRIRAIGDRTPGYRLLEQGPDVLGRVAAAAVDDGWMVAWLGAGEHGATALKAAVLGPTLEERSRHTLRSLPGGRNLGVPRLAAGNGLALVVWTEPSEGTDRGTRLRAAWTRSRQGPDQAGSKPLPNRGSSGSSPSGPG